MKNTLRVKKINEFIDTLNEREQEYLKKQIIKIINDREIGQLNFTIHANGKTTKIIA